MQLEDMTMLPLVEEFYSLQGEGYHAGKAAYFIRIGGCDIGCSWCDSRFSWNPDIHPLVSADEIVSRAVGSGADSVIITGGEPMMWNLDYLCKLLKNYKLSTFLETSGAYPLSGSWDWICVSPKRNVPPKDELCKAADELKVIIKDSSDFEWAEEYRSKVNGNCKLFLQPEWSNFNKVISEIVEYIKRKPEWRVSLQIHKYMHIP